MTHIPRLVSLIANKRFLLRRRLYPVSLASQLCPRHAPIIYKQHAAFCTNNSSDDPDHANEPKETKSQEKNEEETTHEEINAQMQAPAIRFPVNAGVSILSQTGQQPGLGESAIMPIESFPSKVFMIPVTRPFLPGFTVGVIVSRESALELLRHQKENKVTYVGMFLCSDYDSTHKVSGTVYPVGTLAEVKNLSTFVGDSGYGKQQIIVSSVGRIKLASHESPIFSRKNVVIKNVDIEPLESPDYDRWSSEAKYYKSQILSCISGIVQLSAPHKIQYAHINTVNPQNLSYLADTAAFLSTTSIPVIQDILEENDIIQRAHKSLKLIAKELEIMKVRISLQEESNEKMKEFVESKKKDVPMSAERTKWATRMQENPPPANVQEIITEEMTKYSSMPTTSSEYATVRNYIDWLTQIPWGTVTKDNFDLDVAQKILEENHYGLKDVKDRIIEFIAVGAMKQQIETAVSHGKIICLIGSPGVGKTSIGKSIAAALQRKFHRIAVGGMRDVSEIKGHRRTYIGSLPGKIVQALKHTKSFNPVIVIDEIEKLSRSTEGDPASALLEVLDPEQNKEFMDHYLDVPVDLSQVLFVCTGNSVQSIPEPLMDRMEIIEVPGYTTYEKVKIAEDYLIPKASKETGLDVNAVKFPDGVLHHLIDEYCREPGVRVLQQKIESLFRQSAVSVVKKEGNQLVLSKENLREYLGKPNFSLNESYLDAPAGIVVGLGYTAYGGNILILETVSYPVSGDSSPQPVKITGNLGQVLIESATVAQAFARTLLRKYEPDNHFYDKNNVSIHLPNGAVKKEGPSAGIALVSALVSLATGKKVDSRLAMTGEVTLTGRIIAVGGIKEKLLGAQRSGIKRICLPAENQFDFEELDDQLKQEFDEVKFFSRYEQLYEHLFQPTETLSKE